MKNKQERIEEMEKYDRLTALRVLQDLSNKMYPNFDLFGRPTLVINREEFEEVRKKWLDDPAIGNVLEVNKEIEKACKETAEKHFNAIIKALEAKKASIITHYGIKESVGADVAIRTVKYLAEQFGVEIKE